MGTAHGERTQGQVTRRSQLERMRRRYTADALRGIAASLRESRPDLVITTDLIVGFPGESEADFEATLALVRDVGFIDSYSFKYSERPGTGAAAHGLDAFRGKYLSCVCHAVIHG